MTFVARSSLNTPMALVFTDSDFQRFAQFDGPELLRLYQFLIQRLQPTPMEAVVSVRLPPETAGRLKQLAVTRRLTRSDVIREAVSDFTRRHPV